MLRPRKIKYGLGGDPTKPVYKTQAEIEAANQAAKAFVARKRQTDITPAQDVYVALKPGDPVVPYVNPDGTPYQPSLRQGKKSWDVPLEVGLSDIKNDGTGNFFYADPQSGDMRYVDSGVLNLPRFKKQQSLTAMKKKGGYMELGGQNNPYFAMRNVELGLGLLSGNMDRNRQNQYMRDQYSQLGQPDPTPIENFQPNPFSLYAKFGGSLHKRGKMY
jgi:hypothetical protein